MREGLRLLNQRKMKATATPSSSLEFPVHNNNSSSAVVSSSQPFLISKFWGGLLLLLVLLVLSSPVSCAPMIQDEEITPEDHPQHQSVSVSGNVLYGSPRNFVVQPQHQLYLPSLFKTTEINRSDESDGSFSPHQSQQEADIRISPSSSMRNLKPDDFEFEKGTGESKWETVIDPHLYLLTEWGTNSLQDQQQRKRRSSGPSLSIVNPLDVLRQRLLLEIARRKMRQSHNQIMANAEILKSIGRRRRR